VPASGTLSALQDGCCGLELVAILISPAVQGCSLVDELVRPLDPRAGLGQAIIIWRRLQKDMRPK